MFREIAKRAGLRALAWVNAKAQPPAEPGQTSFRVAITGAGDPQIEMVEAESAVHAAEKACCTVAHRRLRATTERSWRLVAIVNESRFEVDVSCYLKAEVCGGNQ